MQSNALTNWLIKNVSGKRYFFIGPDYEMGRSTISAFQDDIKRLGGTDVGATYPPLGAKDFTPYVGQIRAARPDVIMTATAGNDTVRLLTQLKEYGILSDKLTLAGAAGAVTQEIIGAMGGAAEGFLSAAGYSIDIDTPANKKFVAAFKKDFQNDPDLFGADTYGLFYLFKQAIEKAGSIDPAKLRAAMEDAHLGDAARHEEDPQGRSSGSRRHGRREGERHRFPDRRQGAWRRKPSARTNARNSDRNRRRLGEAARWKTCWPTCTSWCCPSSSMR